MQHLSEVRRDMLHHLKQAPGATMTDLAERLELSTEAVRQHLVVLAREGWVQRKRQPAQRVGRPTNHYYLTTAGDHLFPKHYDALAAELVASVAENLGDEALRTLLASLTKTRVLHWLPKVHGKPLRERLDVLQDLYLEADPFMEVEDDGATLRLVERNCPFLNVAQKHRALCSVSVATLRQLLGVQVQREETFQAGDGRCVFRIKLDEPVDTTAFEMEPPPGKP